MKTQTSPQPPVSTSKLARQLGCSISFVYRHRSEMPGQFRVGRCIRWNVQEVLCWMRRRALKGGPDVV